jgi:hypothetical protein
MGRTQTQREEEKIQTNFGWEKEIEKIGEKENFLA